MLQARAKKAKGDTDKDVDQEEAAFASSLLNNFSTADLNNLEKYKLEKSIDWKIAIVKSVKKFSAEIETENSDKGIIEYKDISWTKKEFEQLLKPGDIIYVKNRSRLIRVKTEDLLFVEALKDYVVIHTRTESYTIHSTMKDVETKLGDTDFMRVHRSYIVNIEAIESIKYAIITMDGIEKEIPVGGSYKDQLAQRINLL